jgi:hypothetical protein
MPPVSVDSGGGAVVVSVGSGVAPLVSSVIGLPN